MHFGPMPRYFFNIRNDIHTDDEEGRDLPNLQAALETAIESARELVCADIKKGWLNLDHYIEVLDERRILALRVTFREAFEIREEN